MHTRRLFRAIIVLLGILPGCAPPSPYSARASLKNLSPKDFFSDPRLIRLAEAVDKGDADAIDAAVREGADVNARGKDGYALLFWAMARNSVTGFESLVNNGADLTAEYRNPVQVPDIRLRDFIIRIAVEAKNSDFLAAALRQGFDPNFILDKERNSTLLFIAGAAHSERSMQLLLEAGADLEHQDLMGYTALGDAMLRRDFKTMWFLMRYGANPMTGSSSGADIPSQLKKYGSRGVRPDHQEYYEKVVDLLVDHGLITRQDIIKADKPKHAHESSSLPDINVIEHSPDSKAGQVILDIERTEREADRRDSR
jgi:hypothetical protein